MLEDDVRTPPLSRVGEAILFPVTDGSNKIVAPWVRVGQVDDWSFAIEPASWMGMQEGVAQRLSEGTESFVLEWTAKPTYQFGYCVDGDGALWFDIGMPWYRDGGDPDRLLNEMRQVGMETEPPSPPRPRRPNRVLHALALVTIATGLLVPESVAHGPLLTCQRRPSSPG